MPRKPRSALAVKRHVFIRQVAIFGVIAAVLAVVGVVAAGAYTGRLTIGFISHPFSSPTPSATDYGPTPCPASDDAKYPANAKITVRVLNASTITGAAGSVGQTLQARGFKVDSVASISEDFQGSILVRAGYKGIDAAYMVLTHMPDDAKLTVDDRDTSVVDVIIGAKYNGIRPA
ncbi:MAG: LytR C-terminal domain-containing protein, partial [Bifidobacteriaceae bacterium]|nr:LytR C-terminal domain-containing protein [Bifidobacteriaceae bacterium]